MGTDAALGPEDLEELAYRYLRHLEARGTPFPLDPWAQLQGAIEAVFRSWQNPRARTYRRIYGIPEDLGTAVVVQAMVFGNLGEDSGTGVGFTRNPATGEKGLYGEYLRNAQGEDVVAGVRTPEPLERLKGYAPGLYEELLQVAERLERHFRDMQDFEFTVERGRLFLLQTRAGKRTAQAAVRIAVEMAEEGLISREEAVMRVEANALPGLLRPSVDRDQAPRPLLKGLPASPGAAVGHAAFTNEAVERFHAQGLPAVLVRPETTPEDITGMYLAKGILTARGGLTSHAAVVARGLGVPAVVGAEALRVFPGEGRALAEGVEIREGDLLTLDGGTGEVYLGAVPLVEAGGRPFWRSSSPGRSPIGASGSGPTPTPPRTPKGPGPSGPRGSGYAARSTCSSGRTASLGCAASSWRRPPRRRPWPWSASSTSRRRTSRRSSAPWTASPSRCASWTRRFTSSFLPWRRSPAGPRRGTRRRGAS